MAGMSLQVPSRHVEAFHHALEAMRDVELDPLKEGGPRRLVDIDAALLQLGWDGRRPDESSVLTAARWLLNETARGAVCDAGERVGEATDALLNGGPWTVEEAIDLVALLAERLELLRACALPWPAPGDVD